MVLDFLLVERVASHVIESSLLPLCICIPGVDEIVSVFATHGAVAARHSRLWIIKRRGQDRGEAIGTAMAATRIGLGSTMRFSRRSHCDNKGSIALRSNFKI